MMLWIPTQDGEATTIGHSQSLTAQKMLPLLSETGQEPVAEILLPPLAQQPLQPARCQGGDPILHMNYVPINLPSHLQFHCITWRIKPFPSCTVSRSPEQLKGGLGWCSAAPASARRFARENMTGFVSLRSLADMVSAPACCTDPWKCPNQCCFLGKPGPVSELGCLRNQSPGCHQCCAGLTLGVQGWGPGVVHSEHVETHGGANSAPCTARSQPCLSTVFWKWVSVGRVTFWTCLSERTRWLCVKHGICALVPTLSSTLCRGANVPAPKPSPDSS